MAIIWPCEKTLFLNFSNNVTESLSFCWKAHIPILVIASKTGNNEEISVLRVTFQSTLLRLKLVKSMGILLVAFSYANKHNC